MKELKEKFNFLDYEVMVYKENDKYFCESNGIITGKYNNPEDAKNEIKQLLLEKFLKEKKEIKKELEEGRKKGMSR